MREVTVTYHQDIDSWWAESQDLDGFTAAGNSFSELRPLVAEGVAFYLDDEPFVLFEILESGAQLMDGIVKASGWTGSSWSGQLAMALSAPRQSVEIRHTEYA
jgi:predicted RNase H-like HicB family nuclease